MNTNRSDAEARRYLKSTGARASGPEYDRALRKASSSFAQLHEAVRIAQAHETRDELKTVRRRRHRHA